MSSINLRWEPAAGARRSCTRFPVETLGVGASGSVGASSGATSLTSGRANASRAIAVGVCAGNGSVNIHLRRPLRFHLCPERLKYRCRGAVHNSRVWLRGCGVRASMAGVTVIEDRSARSPSFRQPGPYPPVPDRCGCVPEFAAPSGPQVKIGFTEARPDESD